MTAIPTSAQITTGSVGGTVKDAPDSRIITGRNTTMNLTSPADPVTITNLPYDATGAIIPTRVRPANAGFGQANAWQQERRIQAQIRFSF